MVLDPFCGCGTTIDAAEKLGRKWIGIDITQLATSLIKSRLRDTYGDKIEIVTVGEPTTPNEAGILAEEDKFQFQWWALGLVSARPVEQKKGADHGIDGKILFRDDLTAARPEQIILQVKGGKTGVKDVRDLRGVLDREKAAMGVLISLQPPTREMQAEAASIGFYEHKMNKQKYPRIQLRTVKELMTGKGIERPSNVAAVDETFKKAPESKKKHGEQMELVASAVRADLEPALKRLAAIAKIKDDAKMKSELEKLLAEWPAIKQEVLKNRNTARAFERILGEAFISGLMGKRP